MKGTYAERAAAAVRAITGDVVEVSALGGGEVLYVRHPSSASLLLYLHPKDRRRPITKAEAQEWAASIPAKFGLQSRDRRYTEPAKAAAAEAYQATVHLERVSS